MPLSVRWWSWVLFRGEEVGGVACRFRFFRGVSCFESAYVASVVESGGLVDDDVSVVVPVRFPGGGFFDPGGACCGGAERCGRVVVGVEEGVRWFGQWVGAAAQVQAPGGLRRYEVVTVSYL